MLKIFSSNNAFNKIFISISTTVFVFILLGSPIIQIQAQPSFYGSGYYTGCSDGKKDSLSGYQTHQGKGLYLTSEGKDAPERDEFLTGYNMGYHICYNESEGSHQTESITGNGKLSSSTISQGYSAPSSSSNYGSPTTHNNSTNTDWAKYSNASNGVSFDYPSTWKVEYPLDPYNEEIKASDPFRHSEVLITLPSQYMQDLLFQYSGHQDEANVTVGQVMGGLQNMANDMFGKAYGTTIIEPFTEKTINGFPSVMGTVSIEGTLPTDKGIATIALLMHNGEVYSFSYFDAPDNYYTADSQATMKRIILSLQL